jgi:hypothetical protein
VVEPDFAITGTGRSGTGWISQVLTVLGIRTGHEEWWNPFNHRTGSLEGDASWCAAPYLEKYDGRVGLQIRDPLKVLGSLMNGQIFGPGSNKESPYFKAKAAHVDFTGNELEDAARYIVDWVGMVEPRADVTWQLETLDAEQLVEIVDVLAGQEISVEAAGQALEMVPKSHNKHRHTLQFKWSDIPSGGVFDELRALTERYGYEVA